MTAVRERPTRYPDDPDRTARRARRVPVERISEQASNVRVGRLLLTVLAAVFFAIGWLIGKAVLALVWCGVAVKVGWQDARKAQPRGTSG